MTIDVENIIREKLFAVIEALDVALDATFEIERFVSIGAFIGNGDQNTLGEVGLVTGVVRNPAIVKSGGFLKNTGVGVKGDRGTGVARSAFGDL